MSQIIIFGNGLGRAVDDAHFNLERALGESWNDPDLLSPEQKALIISCLPNQQILDDEQPPTSESQLSDLQKVLSACDTIKAFETRVPDDQTGWLSPHGIEFPQAIRKYIHHTASSFYDDEKYLPRGFSESLRGHIINNGPTVATLNYDDLLYECFAGTDVFNRHILRDGFLSGPFDFDQARNRRDAAREGWFLHLHGSPLFVTKEGQPTKIRRDQFAEYVGTDSTHLVLTNVEAKTNIIAGSEILDTYWKELKAEITVADSILLVGYAGSDKHLNRLISNNLPVSATIRIVEFNEANFYSDEERRAFWGPLFSASRSDFVEIIRMDDILEFRNWSVPQN